MSPSQHLNFGEGDSHTEPSASEEWKRSFCCSHCGSSIAEAAPIYLADDKTYCSRGCRMGHGPNRPGSVHRWAAVPPKGSPEAVPQMLQGKDSMMLLELRDSEKSFGGFQRRRSGSLDEMAMENCQEIQEKINAVDARHFLEPLFGIC